MHMPVTSQLCFLLISTRVRLVANDAPGLPQPGGHVWLKPMADDAVPRLTKAMLSGPRDVFILYQRDDENGTKYKIQRTLAEGARDIQWYTPEQMEQGVLNLLLPRFVRREYDNEASRLAEEESQTDKDPFSEGWLIAANASDFVVIADILRLKAAPNKQPCVDSMMASAFVLDLSDCDDASQAQKRGELCLRALMDKMPKKPLKWGSSKCNLDAVIPRPDPPNTVERMWKGEIMPWTHPLDR